MHSHERTLLSKLGFDDTDKGNERHDLACEYISVGAHARLLFPSLSAGDGRIEVPISKGSGQYKTTIGFIDAAFRGEYEIYGTRAELVTMATAFEVKIKPVGVGDIVRQINLYREYPDPFCMECLGAEGLVDPRRPLMPVSLKEAYWGLIADFDLSDGAIATLDREGIKFARLGPRFEKWLKARSVKSRPHKVL